MQLIENLKNEIKIQKRLHHPHIIQLFDFFEDHNNIYLVLEYAENGNLRSFLKRKKRLSEKEAFIYFIQACLGVDFLHKKNIIHRDLKVFNKHFFLNFLHFLFFSKFSLKIFF